MSLATHIDEEIKNAMRAKESDKLSLLRMLKAAVKNAAIEKGGADAHLEDAEVVAVVRKLVKQREDSVASFEKGGRPELAAKERAEIAILSTYLPTPLTDAEVEALLDEAISEVGGADKSKMGAIMKVANAKAAGRVDGRTLSAALQKRLS
ncbi:MAG: GatB/YqeY domain-containing protein [Verrucomicrobiia bacterium]